MDYASISGRVLDPSGAAVPGAQVTARHTHTNLTGSTATNQDGRFRFPYLRIGPYEISIRQQGFTEATRRLTLAAGAAFELPVTLSVEGVDAQLTVTGETTMLDAARTQIAGTVSDVEVKALPLNSMTATRSPKAISINWSGTTLV